MPAHWTDDFYGEVYFATVQGLLPDELSSWEAELMARLLGVGPASRVLDLACGQGRHAWPLAERVGCLIGLERSRAALRDAMLRSGAAWPCFVRADLRALPLRPGSFDGVVSWYGSLFMYDDATNEAALREVGRLLRPGGRLLVHTGNPLALAAQPHAEARQARRDGSVVEETSDFDPATGVDRSTRRLRRADGRVLEATSELRYYFPAEWEPLAARAGLRLLELTSCKPPPGGALGPDAPDLIALLEAS